ncbi:hypothetical protein CXG81DRAFT_10361 [Caulochytrium protostelioides]|uniref:EamA domain-containing protein n=1 Tax=Caulochytrium protostelioides TaxID=1555241 RepID=A0A4P9XBJ2_9FUNG|nr:hypothetical protein CXG81DRAFT_10361 [Caulochytrium protostelioides]|eukprot:RKP02773.1 hypothetical protein CXG81DRAFT_10361 [Caulochytrium protostelioides]
MRDDAAGTMNTMFNKLQDMTPLIRCPKETPCYFEQPVWQTLTMFIGEFLCLCVFYGARDLVNPDDDDAMDDVNGHLDDDDDDSLILSPAGPTRPLSGAANMLFWLPTLCDLTATTLMNAGLIFTSASIYQMLRGSVVLFTGTLSTAFLGRRHPLYRWFALIVVFVGVAIVGMSGPSSTAGPVLEDPMHGSPGMPPATPPGIPHPTPGPLPGPGLDDVAARNNAWGVTMVIFAQLFTATQFVLEEKIMLRYDVPAIKAVGLEGFFGLATTLALMPILHLTIGVRDGPTSWFNVPQGWYDIVDNRPVLLAGIGIIFSIAFFNWFGLSVTQRISATSRSTIDTCRTLFIWMLSLALGWETFKWMQVLGFVVLIYGTFVFNDVLAPPPIPWLSAGRSRRVVLSDVGDDDRHVNDLDDV